VFVIASGIYLILNLIDYKAYVGQSVNLKKRISVHKSTLRGNYHENEHLQRAYNKYGSDNFLFEILEECDVDSLDEREIFWISEFNSTDRELGYNGENIITEAERLFYFERRY